MLNLLSVSALCIQPANAPVRERLQETSSMQLSNMVPLDPFEITQIDRMEHLETRGGIKISAVMATAEPEKRGKDKYKVHVLAEMEVIGGQPLKHHLTVYAACYNSNGQIHQWKTSAVPVPKIAGLNANRGRFALSCSLISHLTN